MGVKRKTEWSEYKIQQVLRKYFLAESTKKYDLFNLFIYQWESDYLAITRSDIVYECEIKISRQDFLNDSKKKNKHLIIEGNVNGILYDYDRPNYFYYAVPDGLIKVDEVPDYAGLIYANPGYINVVKPAPKQHNGKFDYEKHNLMDKLYYNLNNYRDLYKESDILELKKTIKAQEKQMFWYDEELSKVNLENDELKLILKNNGINYNIL
jgi:hypothetical protein